jgi:hypothetical protein
VPIGYAVIHRDSLTLTPLMIDDSGTYGIDDDGIVETEVEYIQDIASSPVVEGDFVTHDIRGMVTQQTRVQVRGADHTALQANIGVLLAAVQQPNFVFDLVIGGVTWSWACRRKTYGLRLNRQMIFARVAVVPVTFERYPNPLAGPY